MLIDWFTVGAQVVNFLILVYLLKRFLYRPILHAIDAREAHIATMLEDASDKQQQANAERDDLTQKNKAFEQEKERRLAEVANAAEQEENRLLAKAKQRAEAMSQKYQHSLVTDAKNFSKTLRLRASTEIFSISRTVLKQIANVHLEAEVVELFLQQLNELNESSKTAFMTALASLYESNPLVVSSAFELSKTQRHTICKALSKYSETEIDIRFEANDKLISGIELVANGQKVKWSIDDYLLALEKEITLMVEHNLSQSSSNNSIKTAKQTTNSSKGDNQEYPLTHKAPAQKRLADHTATAAEKTNDGA